MKFGINGERCVANLILAFDGYFNIESFIKKICQV
jgi:hypothetical protein